MRQLSSLLGTATAGAGPQPVLSTIIPPNSWANGKRLLIRGFYSFTIPAGPLPPNYNVKESIGSTQGTTTVLLTPPAFVPVASVYTTFIERCLIRIDPDIRVYDHGDIFKFNWANLNDTLAHVLTHAATVPPYNYALQMQIDCLFTLPPAIPGATIVGKFCESFLEQATNLGKLP